MMKGTLLSVVAICLLALHGHAVSLNHVRARAATRQVPGDDGPPGPDTDMSPIGGETPHDDTAAETPESPAESPADELPPSNMQSDLPDATDTPSAPSDTEDFSSAVQTELQTAAQEDKAIAPEPTAITVSPSKPTGAAPAQPTLLTTPTPPAPSVNPSDVQGAKLDAVNSSTVLSAATATQNDSGGLVATPPAVPAAPASSPPPTATDAPASTGDAPSADASAADWSAPPQPAINVEGYNRLVNMVGKVQENILYDQLASDTEHTRDMQRCDDAIGKLNVTINNMTTIVDNANRTAQRAHQALRDERQRLHELHAVISPKEAELSAIISQLSKGETARQLEKEANHQKVEDTMAVMNAVRVIFEKLDVVAASAPAPTPPAHTSLLDPSSTVVNDSNTSTPVVRFRETLRKVAARVSDTHLQSVIEAAMQVLNMGSGSASDNTTTDHKDVGGVRQLMALLLTELTDYLNDLNTREEAAKNLWTTTRGQLKEQQDLFEHDLKDRRALFQTVRGRVDEHKKQLRSASSVLHSLPSELNTYIKEREMWQQDCEDSKNVYTQEEVDREVQLSTLDAVSKMTVLKKDPVAAKLLEMITHSVNVPEHRTDRNGMRCCVVCASGIPCVDHCLPRGQRCPYPRNSPAFALDWCACAAAEVMSLQAIQEKAREKAEQYLDTVY